MQRAAAQLGDVRFPRARVARARDGAALEIGERASQLLVREASLLQVGDELGERALVDAPQNRNRAGNRQRNSLGSLRRGPGPRARPGAAPIFARRVARPRGGGDALGDVPKRQDGDARHLLLCGFFRHLHEPLRERAAPHRRERGRVERQEPRAQAHLVLQLHVAPRTGVGAGVVARPVSRVVTVVAALRGGAERRAGHGAREQQRREELDAAGVRDERAHVPDAEQRGERRNHRRHGAFRVAGLPELRAAPLHELHEGLRGDAHGRGRGARHGVPAARRGDRAEPQVLGEAALHEARQAEERLLLREPVGLGEDAEEVRVRVPLVRAGRAVEVRGARLVLREHLHDQREDVIRGVLVRHVAQDVQERLREIWAGLLEERASRERALVVVAADDLDVRLRDQPRGEQRVPLHGPLQDRRDVVRGEDHRASRMCPPRPSAMRPRRELWRPSR
mmetsp:Transcript_1113/g.4358  ORF Transcript_1113/g.4358 Transcript_1113/m.4358 type:complete len:452 (+) Transcript_1113:801-2156(+)